MEPTENELIEWQKDEIGGRLAREYLKIGAIFYIPEKKGSKKPEFGKVLSFADDFYNNSYVFYKPLKSSVKKIFKEEICFQGWPIGNIYKCVHEETDGEKQIYKTQLKCLHAEHFFDSEFKLFPEVGEEWTYNSRTSAPLPDNFITEEKKFSLLPRRTVLLGERIEKIDGIYKKIYKKVDETFF